MLVQADFLRISKFIIGRPSTPRRELFPYYELRNSSKNHFQCAFFKFIFLRNNLILKKEEDVSQMHKKVQKETSPSHTL